MPIVGVLAIQGDFREHISLLNSLGAEAIEVKGKSDFSKCDALIIPGGESTTIANLLSISGLDVEIRKRVAKGMPLLGTCAGAILSAKKVIGEKRYKPLKLINIEVRRNAYGRQADSFEAELEVKGVGKVNGVFIRAPIISKAGRGVEVLASFSGKPVLVRQKNVIAATFHPELVGEGKIHQMLIEMMGKKTMNKE